MSYYPGTPRLIYSMIVPKAGDTIAATAVETNFASNVVIPALAMVPGSIFTIDFAGTYTTPGLTAPTTIAKVKMGTVELLATAALTNPAGSNALGYSGKVIITVQTSGVSGILRSNGALLFNSSTTNGVPVNAYGTATVNTTINNTLQLAVLFGNANAGNSNSLTQLIIHEARPVKASN